MILLPVRGSCACIVARVEYHAAVVECVGAERVQDHFRKYAQLNRFRMAHLIAVAKEIQLTRISNASEEARGLAHELRFTWQVRNTPIKIEAASAARHLAASVRGPS